jgi:hypothetical protein
MRRPAIALDEPFGDVSLFPLAPYFDSGISLSKDDHVALGKGLLRVLAVLRDGYVHTVQEIAKATGDPEASVSANCRNLRKSKHGGHDVRLVHLTGRTFGYQLQPADQQRTA